MGKHLTSEDPNGTEREGYKGLPFAGHPITSHEALLDHYFEHPTSTTESPLGDRRSVSDMRDYTG